MDSDGSSMLIETTFLLCILIFRAICTVCETACTAMGEGKIKSLSQSDDKKEQRLYKILRKPLRLITMFSSLKIFTAVCVTFICVECYFLPLSELMKKYSDSSYDTLFYVLSGIIILILIIFVLTVITDGIPRRVTVLGNKNPYDTTMKLLGFLNFLTVCTLPLTVINEKLIAGVSSSFGVDKSAEKELITEEDIMRMVDAGNESGVIEENQREMINNVFEFGDLPVSDVMTHRTDIAAVSDDKTISELVYLAINTGFSRIPVYHESVDHIIGIVCVKDLLCLVGGMSADSMTLSGFVRDVIFFPEKGLCGTLFERMTKEKTQLAVVVDEYGGTAGIVSLEDLIEAVMGNIQDEYDNEAEEITKISEYEYTIDGKANPEEILSYLGVQISEDIKYDTMSSFFIDLYGKIPTEGEMPAVIYENIEFTALYIEDMRVSRLKAAVLKEKEDNDLNRSQENKKGNERDEYE